MLIGRPELAKEVLENRDKSKITKQLKFPICFLSKGDNLQILTNMINSKLISELVSSDKSVFLSFMQHKYGPILKSITLFCACAIAKFIE